LLSKPLLLPPTPTRPVDVENELAADDVEDVFDLSQARSRTDGLSARSVLQDSQTVHENEPDDDECSLVAAEDFVDTGGVTMNDDEDDDDSVHDLTLTVPSVANLGKIFASTKPSPSAFHRPTLKREGIHFVHLSELLLSFQEYYSLTLFGALGDGHCLFRSVGRILSVPFAHVRQWLVDWPSKPTRRAEILAFMASYKVRLPESL
jgi:hypothetical protein